MGFIDSLIAAAVIITFVLFVGSKIYNHEKEVIDPIIKKIKGWFTNDDEGDGSIGPDDDFELAFRGQLSNY